MLVLKVQFTQTKVLQGLFQTQNSFAHIIAFCMSKSYSLCISLFSAIVDIEVLWQQTGETLLSTNVEDEETKKKWKRVNFPDVHPVSRDRHPNRRAIAQSSVTNLQF